MVLALAALVPVACDRGESTAAIDREDYIQTYVELLKAAAEAPDSAAATDSARAVLRRRGVSETDLSDFALSHADDPGYMASVWGEIENRLRERPPPPEEPEGTPE